MHLEALASCANAKPLIISNPTVSKAEVGGCCCCSARPALLVLCCALLFLARRCEAQARTPRG